MTKRNFDISAVLAEEGAPPAKAAILSAALKLFAAKGIDGVSIRDVAAAAGFTNPALYKHYKSKEAMAGDLFETCYRHMVARMEAATKSDLPFHGEVGPPLDGVGDRWSEEELRGIVSNSKMMFAITWRRDIGHYV